MRIIENPDLSKMSTLKMGGIAMKSFYPEDFHDLDKLSMIWADLGENILILGRGSNILFGENNSELCVICWSGKDSPELVVEKENIVRVMADAGLSLPSFLRWCAKHGLTGLEGLTGIPGSLGGAVAMNAGSYGSEVLDYVEKVTVWTPEDGIKEFFKDDFQKGYRKFSLKSAGKNYIIINACFALKKSDQELIKLRMRHNYQKKKQSQPVLESTAGCVFKNPEGHPPAGFLLEKAGFKGKARKGVGFSDRHANFLVNISQGQSRDALELISEAREKVQELFGVNLELEVKVI
ncbi:MAG: UDP-N-acetylmuramate dehydrogenase [Desulfonatronovibrio sp. MSAO_Bac4]|nr:MAG: UDP-N-acetylmuramate dehydrogenase [Desulfonatronovibrio sp. MSAO_Bac4]